MTLKMNILKKRNSQRRRQIAERSIKVMLENYNVGISQAKTVKEIGALANYNRSVEIVPCESRILEEKV